MTANPDPSLAAGVVLLGTAAAGFHDPRGLRAIAP